MLKVFKATCYLDLVSVTVRVTCSIIRESYLVITCLEFAIGIA